MRALFEPSGTHVHKDRLKIRLDLYPDVGDKTYGLHHDARNYSSEPYPGEMTGDMREPVDVQRYREWQANKPFTLQDNPCLCAYLYVPEIVTLDSLTGYIHQTFDRDMVSTLDNALILLDSARWVSAIMKGKARLTDQKVTTKDLQDLFGTINARFAGLSIPLSKGGQILPIEPRSIDVGPGAIDGDDDQDLRYTVIEQANPANASGIIDTVEIWAHSNLSSCDAALFFVVAGTNFTSRDYEALGAITAGSKQTVSSLDITVETGDYIGHGSSEGSSAGDMERDEDGDCWYKEGHYTDCTNEEFAAYGRKYSIYGTGEETPVGQQLFTLINEMGY